MRLLVTGGAGYLGSEIARVALERGHDVLATELTNPAPHGRAVRVDLRSEADVARIFLRWGPEVVIHTAYRQRPDEEVWDAVVRATANVAVAADRSGARLVHLSTDLVFDGELERPYREEDEAKPLVLYGEAKLAAERLVAELQPQALVVRTSLLYGKADPGPQEQLALAGDTSFYTDEIRCPTLVGDVAAALLDLAARDDVSGLLHLAAPDAVSRYELARLLRSAHGADPDAIVGEPSPAGL
ncbi:MAG: dTDP-4-dehydrorhamnose reductase, partial [Gaiellaceae bacterium]|nr:dTDP-4-dehydrorhamnose reductase [Gaiellaceae bacterium]